MKVDIKKRKDLFLGLVTFMLLAIGVGGYYYFSAQSLLLRVLALLTLACLSAFLLFKMTIGQKFWIYWQESLGELRKVVWPTKKETVQSTVGVLAMVFVMGIFLWSVDAVLVRIVAWLLRHNGV